jgi:hypothetical protein
MRGIRNPARPCDRPVFAGLLLILACASTVRGQTGVSLIRALPLNHFPYSRQYGADTRGYHFTPTAIGDDYFDGTSPPERIRRHLRAARQLGAKYLRCAFSWNGIEKEQGKYDWAF